MRLFVALDIPEEVRNSLAELVAQLRPVCQNARWARVEGLHVTLKFIGEAPLEKVEVIKTALSSIPTRAPIPIDFQGFGFFPNDRRPRVLWAGVEAGPELRELALAVETALDSVGIPRETRPFAPHLTLARFESSRGLDALHAAIQNTGSHDFGRTTATEFHLYQSVLKRRGAEYTQLATFSFAEGRPA
jgi:RNA 2',3'-cyclic 3'-phosphodiesterase